MVRGWAIRSCLWPALFIAAVACGEVEEDPPDGSAPPDGGGAADGAMVADAGTPDAMIAATCTAANEGALCGDRVCEPTGECLGFVDVCDEGGDQAATCTEKRCQSGACTIVDLGPSTVPCTRDTDGVSCGSDLCDPCAYASECANGGSRTCVRQVCGSGSCGAGTAFTDTAACARLTDGNVCGGGTTCTAYDGNCTTDCQEDRTCTDQACGGGTCNPSTRTETRQCASGALCGMGICAACGARFDKICTATGSCVNTESCADLCGP